MGGFKDNKQFCKRTRNTTGLCNGEAYRSFCTVGSVTNIRNIHG